MREYGTNAQAFKAELVGNANPTGAAGLEGKAYPAGAASLASESSQVRQKALAALFAIGFALSACLFCACPSRAFAMFNEVTDSFPALQDLESYDSPITGSQLPDGVYQVVGRTTSRMCIMYLDPKDAEARDSKEQAIVSVENGQMTAIFYLSKAYTHIFMGTMEQAAAATNKAGTSSSNYIAGDPPEGYVPHLYAIPIAALNKPMTISTYSGGDKGLENGKWYTREFIFKMSETDFKKIVANAAAQKEEQKPAQDTQPADEPTTPEKDQPAQKEETPQETEPAESEESKSKSETADPSSEADPDPKQDAADPSKADEQPKAQDPDNSVEPSSDDQSKDAANPKDDDKNDEGKTPADAAKDGEPSDEGSDGDAGGKEPPASSSSSSKSQGKLSADNVKVGDSKSDGDGEGSAGGGDDNSGSGSGQAAGAASPQDNGGDAGGGNDGNGEGGGESEGGESEGGEGGEGEGGEGEGDGAGEAAPPAAMSQPMRGVRMTIASPEDIVIDAPKTDAQATEEDAGPSLTPQQVMALVVAGVFALGVALRAALFARGFDRAAAAVSGRRKTAGGTPAGTPVS